MSRSHLTRWIEEAEARRFSELAEFERSPKIAEDHFLHLGDVIAHLPTWFRREVSRDSLAAIGCPARVHLRHADGCKNQ